MRLLIDIGNTRIKWSTCMDGVLDAPGEVLHRSDPDRAVVEFLDKIVTRPAQVLAANVAGEAKGDLIAAAVRARWDLSVDFAVTQSAAGPLTNGYEDYRQMGVDRWLAILAAFDSYRRAVCVVDAGTAVTIDQVDDTGTHLGGVIVPGLDLMWRSLVRETGDIGRLADIDVGVARTEGLVTGRTTAAGINGGSLAAICGLIEHCADQLGRDCGDCVLVVTGGDAEHIIPHVRTNLDHRPSLVLEGLAIYVPD
jgi:type III pantothenate kinase